MQKPPSWQGYVSSLFFLNEYQSLKLGGIAPGTNSPFWTLSFEATYYIIAGLLVFCRWRVSLPLTIALCFFAGRTITFLFPVWAMGFVLYHFRDRMVLSTSRAVALFVISTACLAIAPRLFDWLNLQNLGLYFPWGRNQGNRDIFHDYFVGCAFSLHLLSIQNLLSADGAVGKTAQELSRRIGDLTFPLYCLHMPVICFFASLSPFERSTGANFWFIFVPVISVAVWGDYLSSRLKLQMREALLSFPVIHGRV